VAKSFKIVAPNQPKKLIMLIYQTPTNPTGSKLSPKEFLLTLLLNQIEDLISNKLKTNRTLMLEMDLYILAKCLTKMEVSLNMEKVSRNGQMVRTTKEIGEITLLKEKEYFIMRTVTFIPENFIKIELMDLEFIFIKMVRNMKAFGKWICKMAQVMKNLKMEANTMACSDKVKKMDMENISGLIIAFMLAIGSIIILKEMVNTPGLTEEDTWDSGKTTNFMARGNIIGQMVEDTMVNTNKTRNMDMVLTFGQTAKHTKATGTTVNNMEKPNLQTQKAKVKWEYGKTDRELNG
jgi:hypothetical protein